MRHPIQIANSGAEPITESFSGNQNGPKTGKEEGHLLFCRIVNTDENRATKAIVYISSWSQSIDLSSKPNSEC